MLILIAGFLIGIMGLLALIVIHIYSCDTLHGCSKAQKELLRTTQEDLARTQAELASVKAKTAEKGK